MTGFPIWTLWGMGLAALGALFFLLLALVAQSPGLMRRLGLDVYRLDLRVRAFTGYAFACLLLVGGFFLAGVPLGGSGSEPLAQTATGEPTASGDEAAAPTELAVVEDGMSVTGTLPATAATPSDDRPASGAFGGVPTRATTTPTSGPLQEEGEVVTPDIPTPTLEGSEPLTGTVAAPDTPTPTGTPTPVSTNTPTPTPTNTPTPTPTNTPTATPTPTLTPTPIRGETAILDTDGATVWLLRSPGGQQIQLVRHGDTVILLPRHANQAGLLWREVQTVDGVAGWLPAAYVGEG